MQWRRKNERRLIILSKYIVFREKNNAGLRKTIRFFVRFVIPQIKFYRKYFSLFFLFGIVYNLFIHCKKDD